MNTLESYLADLMRREANVIQLLNSFATLYTDRQSQITVNFVNPDNSTSTFTLPSYNFLISEIRRVENNINQILSSTSLSATLTMPDGTTKVVYSASTITEPIITSSISKPVFFRKINNKIEDYLLNPLLAVQIPINKEIRSVSDTIIVNKLIIDINTVDQVEYFNQNINGGNIQYDVLINNLLSRSIGFTEYEETIKIPHRKLKFDGKFDIISVSRNQITQLIGTQQVNVTQLSYVLNTLQYFDITDGGSKNISLKNGDLLVVNDNQDSTKYEITAIDQSTNSVTLKLKQGNASPSIGVDVLKINQDISDSVFIEVPISSNNYVVFFLKPVNKYFDVISNDWGYGVGVYTSTLVDVDNKLTTLDKIYSNLININDTLTNFTSSNFVPLSKGIKPNPPSILLSNFQVQQTNAHKGDQTQYDDLKSKISQKNKLKSQITMIDDQVADNKSNINTTNTNANISALQNSNTNLLTQKSLLVKQYNTIVSDIVAGIKSLGSNLFNPEYAVNGFWTIPLPQYGDLINKLYPQEAIQFVYAIRKLRPDNTAILTNQIPITNPDGSVSNGSVSNWIESKTKPRQRTLNNDGTISWKSEDTSNPDIVNSNQLSFPISQGESLEIKVKTLSEAGYPGSPMESDYSPSIIVPFPQTLLTNIAIDLTSATDESIMAAFQQYLTTLGVDNHLSDSFQIGTQTFRHEALNIATSQRSQNNDIMDVDTVLNNLTNNYNQLIATISKQKGKLNVQIQDERGNVLNTVSNNDTIDLFAGYYSDSISQLDASQRKGEIITKVFYVVLSNSGQADVELLSYIPGISGERLPGIKYDTGFSLDTTPYAGYVVSKDEYLNYRKYFRVPINIKSIINNDALLSAHGDITLSNSLPPISSGAFTGRWNPYVELPTFQSMQNKGQIIYSRYNDITLGNPLYKESSSGDTLLPNSFITSGGIPSLSTIHKPYIWDDTDATGGGGGLISDFCIHTDHPEMQSGSTFLSSFASEYNASKVPIQNLVPSTYFLNPGVRYPHFAHSKYFNLISSNADGLKQLEYAPYVTEPSLATNSLNFARKLGFTQGDKYLIGQNTCGAYLFMLPPDTKALYSGSAIYNKGVILSPTAQNSIKIPIVMQFRMTDYDGVGSTGTGIIGGYGTPPSVTNLVYSKKIGLDIVVKDQEIFSFDVKVSAQYKPDTTGSIRYVNPPIDQNFVTSFPMI